MSTIARGRKHRLSPLRSARTEVRKNGSAARNRPGTRNEKNSPAQTQTRGSPAKQPLAWTALDATQEALIAKLASSREPWQTIDRYEPERAHEHPRARRANGADIRTSVPHEAHAEWTPPKRRPNPVDIVVAGNAGRQEHLVPLRIGRMAASPFAFLRGAASVMAWDLSHTPVSGIQVMIDGDAHINNFGLYGTPQRDVVIDLNDFDEATIGPWEWDLKRLVASVNVAGRENGLSRKERRRAVRRTVSGYRLNMDRLSAMGVLESWSLFAYAERRPTAVTVPDSAWAIIQKTVAKAKRTTNETLLPKVAHRTNDGGWRFQNLPPVQTRVDDDTHRKVVASLVNYAEQLSPAYRSMLKRYSIADVAHRVVGVGSVGTRAYLTLCFGNGDNDPLFLQVKESIVPVHAAYLPPFIMREQHDGLRVVAAQRTLQALGDPLLGHTTIDGRPYFVRQMKNMKASMPVPLMTGEPFDFWAFLCGALLARAHARSGDAIRIAGYCGNDDTLDQALADFAEAYGDQTERDHAELVKAISAGTVKAVAVADGAL